MKGVTELSVNPNNNYDPQSKQQQNSEGCNFQEDLIL